MSTASTDPAAPIGGLSTDAFSSMFQAISGLRNRRALFAMLGCLFVGILVAGLFSMLAMRWGFFMAFLGGLVLFIASATGVNAAGVLLMDQAKGVPARSLPDAVVYGMMCIPKFIALGLALLLVSLAVFIVIALVYLVCKIPFLGPILFVVVFPLSVVISGLTLCGLFQCLFLALPAIWEGSTITHAIAQALAIVRSRLVESMLLLTVVGFLAMGVGFIVFGVLITGLIPTTGMMAGILGGDGFASMMGLVRGFGGEYGDGYGGSRGGGGGGYAIAAGIGGGLLWALSASLVSLVYLLGLSLVYLRVTEGLDVGATEAAMKAGLDETRRRAAELSQKAKEAAERARDQARQSAAAAPASAPSTNPAAPPPAAMAPPAYSAPPTAVVVKPCPKCLAPTNPDDLFCGVCGTRLK